MRPDQPIAVRRSLPAYKITTKIDELESLDIDSCGCLTLMARFMTGNNKDKAS